MSGVAWYVKFSAQTGRAEELGRLLLGAAESLNATNGCELYLVNRSTSEPDQVWVTELWLDQASLDAGLEQLRSASRARRGSPPARWAQPAPGTTRAFEAGPGGLEFVVFGPHLRGDAVTEHQ